MAGCSAAWVAAGVAAGRLRWLFVPLIRPVWFCLTSPPLCRLSHFLFCFPSVHCPYYLVACWPPQLPLLSCWVSLYARSFEGFPPGLFSHSLTITTIPLHLPLACCSLGVTCWGFIAGVLVFIACRFPHYWGEGIVVTGIYHHPSCAGAWVRTD